MVLINRRMEELRESTSDWLPLRGCLSLYLSLGSLTLEVASCHVVKSHGGTAWQGTYAS